MKLFGRVKERRQHKAHLRYLAERERQKQLSDQDAQRAVRDLAQNSAAQNSTFGLGQ
jgi:hypothetical protein